MRLAFYIPSVSPPHGMHIHYRWRRYDLHREHVSIRKCTPMSLDPLECYQSLVGIMSELFIRVVSQDYPNNSPYATIDENEDCNRNYHE